MGKTYASNITAFGARHFFLAVAALVSSAVVHAQLNVAVINTPYAITFDATVAGVSSGTWAGTGFQPTPVSGRLSSNAWAVNGWSNGNLAFGGTQITGSTDYTRGTTAPGNGAVASGGLYSFGGAGITGRALGFQPGVSDFAPGNVTLRVQNNTGSTLTKLDVSYNLFYRNDQNLSTVFDFLYSEDNVTYTAPAGLAVTSPTTAAGAAWVPNPRSTTITGVHVLNGQYFYIRWRSGDVAGGSGTARDEFALDDISVTGRVGTIVYLASAGASVSENGGSQNIVVSITNPHPTLATTVDVALTSGPAARVGNYTTQTVIFPPGSLANQSQTITLTDNGACDGDAVVTFTLQNPTGGFSADVAPGNYTLNIDDDETGPITIKQAFDGLPTDTWPISAGVANVSALPGSTDTPVNERILSGTASWQVRNVTGTLSLAPVSTQDWSSLKLTARVSSTSLTPTNGADVSDSIAFYVSLNGGAFPADPDVRIGGSTDARWGFSTGLGVASGVVGTPMNYAPVGSNTRTTDGYTYVVITIPNGTSSVALKVIGKNNSGSEVWNLDDITLSGMLCSPIYYSRASGSEVTPTWSTVRTGTPAPAAVTFTKNATMVVQNSHVITTTSNVSLPLRELQVETGGTLNLSGVSTVDINGALLSNSGTLTATDDHIRLLSSTLTTIAGTSSYDLGDLTLDGFGAIVTTNLVRIRGTLQLTNGTFDGNGKDIDLFSNASGTARLGPVSPTANYLNTLRMDRFIPAGVTDWRLLCSPVQGRTISDWTDDFYTAGFPGSAYPNFYSPVGSGIFWPSVRSYNETNTGPGLNDGLVGPTSVTDPLTIGKGFAAWSGTTLNTTTAFTVDVRGLPQIAVTPITLPMSYTSTGVPAVDGLNLVGNPLPSPIDFSLISKGANVDNMYYIYDPGSGQNAAWDENTLLGTGGTNGNIQSSQGFWLHATGSSLTTTVSESAKVLEPIAGGVFSDQIDDRPIVRLKFTTQASNYSDEALVQFINGGPATDVHDIRKFPFGHPEALVLSTLSTTGDDMTINAFGQLEGGADVPVTVDAPVDGEYTITVQDIGPLLGVSCISLEDLHTGVTTPLVEGTSYSFSMLADDLPVPARFVLHVSAPITSERTDVACAAGNDGSITVQGAGSGPWNYALTDVFGNVLTEQNQATTAATFSGLAAGNYRIRVDGSANCGTVQHDITITAPPALGGSATSTASTCSNASDGSADLVIMGGSAPYGTEWSNGATTEDLEGVAAGTYGVVIADAHGCTFDVDNVIVPQGTGPVAAFFVSANELTVGDTLRVYATGTYGVENNWDLGDGFQTDEEEPMHIYGAPGVYTVTLVTTEGDCTDEHSEQVTVMTPTGIAEKVASPLNAWSNGSEFIVQWSIEGSSTVAVDIFDATGRTMSTKQASGLSGRLQLPSAQLPTGVYFVRVQYAGHQRTFRIPVTR